MSAFQLQRRALMEQTCEMCGSTDIVEDRQQGHTVCNECGTILEQRTVYEGSEWRTFNEKDKPGDDPNRVGAAENPLLGGGALGGGMVKNGLDDGGQAFALNRRQHRTGTDPTAKLQKAFNDIRGYCDRMGLANDFKTRAQELYALFQETHTGKTASAKALCCACIFEATKLLNAPRQLKEIDHAVAGEKSIKRDIQRAHKLLRRVVQQKGMEDDVRRGVDIHNVSAIHEDSKRIGVQDAEPSKIHPSAILPRLASELGFTSRGIMVAVRICKLVLPEEETAVHRDWHGAAPATLSAVTLYMSMCLGSRVLMKGVSPREIGDLAAMTRVAETTILTTYAKLHPYLRELIPTDLKPPLKPEEWLLFPTPKVKASAAAYRHTPVQRLVGVDLPAK